MEDGDRPMTSAEKAMSLDAMQRVAERSVVQFPEPGAGQPGGSYTLWVFQATQGIQEWGKNPKLRDRHLREFFPTEPYLASALGIVCARNAAFSYTLEGPPRSVAAAQEMLQNANFGRGWNEFTLETSLDLYSQDFGAFVELVRSGDSERAPVIGINHLDSARCQPTGEPKEPIWYEDRQGRFHKLKWFQVVQLLELPSAIEHPHGGALYKLQYCALTRLLTAAQILKNISTYKEEKTGGRFQRAIHLIKGIKAEDILKALEARNVELDAQGLRRYAGHPVIVGSLDPLADVGHETLELASLPDGFDEEKTIKNYITVMAMAFLTDYQEFAPLPGGGLGTSAQSYILHMKSRGKGPGLFQKLITHLMNFQGVLPRNVEFKFAEQDLEAEREMAEIREARARRLQALTQGENPILPPHVARQIMVDDGDLAPEIQEAMGEPDITGEVTVEDVEKPEGKTLSDAQRRDFERETEEIRASRQTPEARRRHKFRAAKWTHPNGHPRCKVCGDEERVGGWCEGADAEGKARHRPDRCMKCDEPPTKEVVWAEGRARAWFCDKHFAEWLRQNPDETIEVRECPGGRIRSEGEGQGLGRGGGRGPLGKPIGQKAEAADEPRRAGPEDVEEERLKLEATVKEQAQRALQRMRRRVSARLREESG